MRMATRSQKQCGVVLIIVLWIVMLLSLLLTAFSKNIRVEANIVRGLLNDVILRAATEGVAAYLGRLNQSDSERLLQLAGSVQELKIGAKVVHFRLIPEESYVSLNAAPQDLLQVLIQGVAEEEVDAESIAAAIIDWRDADDIPQERGAEDGEYEFAGLAQRPRNKSFQTLDELAMVLGVTRDLANHLKPYLSVNSLSTTVNPLYASDELLMALGGEGMLEVDQGDAFLPGGFSSEASSGIYRLLVALAGDLQQKTAAEVVVTFGSAAPTFEVKGSDSLYHIEHWNRYTARLDDSDG